MFLTMTSVIVFLSQILSVTSFQLLPTSRNRQQQLLLHKEKKILHYSPSPSSPSSSHVIFMSNNENDDNDNDNKLNEIAGISAIACQPVVWISLYYVANTGAGLPAGPFGIIGAVEGISYLVVLAFATKKLFFSNSSQDDDTNSPQVVAAAEILSLATLILSLLILANLVTAQGCVPNAKPILDYSNYLPVCDATPGLFGN